MSREIRKYYVVGKRIKEIREIAGLTQEEFGRRVGCKVDNISKIERGESNPSGSLIIAISREFGINEKWLSESAGSRYKEGAGGAGRIVEAPEIYPEISMDPKRRRLVEEIKALATKAPIYVIDTLLRIVEWAKREPKE